MKLTAVSLAALLACSLAQAAPTASLTTPGASFEEYTGTGPVGNNNINVDGKLYWMFESQGSYLGQAVKSWFLFFDPKKSSSMKGSVSFDQSILHVLDNKADLFATAAFGKPGVTYDYSSNLIGLEAGDSNKTSFAGDTLSFNWTASTPGDHIRVMTAVPEPGTYALLALGLGVLGFVARRRRGA